MKIKRKEKKIKAKVQKFPCLMEGDISGTIYLFKDESNCIVLEALGHISEKTGDSSVTGFKDCKPYNGKLVLSNN